MRWNARFVLIFLAEDLTQVAQLQSDSGDTFFLRDGNDGTCNLVENVTVQWNISYYLSWIRISYDDNGT